MRAIVDARTFSNALDKIGKLKAKSSILIVGEVCVRFSGGTCTLTSTDFSIYLTTGIPAQGDDFSFVFYRTKDVARACRYFDGELAMELTETGNGRHRELRLSMCCGCRSGEFYVQSAEYYPTIPERKEQAAFTACASAILTRAKRVQYAVSNRKTDRDAVRTSIQFRKDSIYALDGYRLSCDTDPNLSIPKPFLAPLAPLALLSLFGDSQVTFRHCSSYMQVTDGDLTLHFRMADGVPFDLASALTKSFKEEFYVRPADFLQELKYLKEFAPALNRHSVRFDGETLSLEGSSGTFTTAVLIDGNHAMEIGFDLCYMADALRQFEKEKRVKVKLSSPSAPIIIEAEGRGDYALILPMRLKEKKENMAA